jgi:hypothetical protein
MTKIEVEDLTTEGLSEEQIERNVMTLANGLVQAAGRSAPALGLAFKEAALALLTAGEILMIIGEKAGKIEQNIQSEIKETATKYAQKKQEELEKTGIMDVIMAVKNVADKAQGGDDE